MTRGTFAIVLVLGAAVALSACRDTADLQAASLAQWKAHCAAQGKQFLWTDTATSRDPMTVQVQVEGRCVGPGDRGYRAPEPPDEP
jgi:hypothetical protein